MEKLEFLWHWHFLLGLLVGWFLAPHLNKIVSKFKK